MLQDLARAESMGFRRQILNNIEILTRTKHMPRVNVVYVKNVIIKVRSEQKSVR